MAEIARHTLADIDERLNLLELMLLHQAKRIAELEARVADRMLAEMSAAVPTVAWPEFPPIHDPNDPAKRGKL